jgi:hypothetical protein
VQTRSRTPSRHDGRAPRTQYIGRRRLGRPRSDQADGLASFRDRWQHGLSLAVESRRVSGIHQPCAARSIHCGGIGDSHNAKCQRGRTPECATQEAPWKADSVYTDLQYGCTTEHLARTPQPPKTSDKPPSYSEPVVTSRVTKGSSLLGRQGPELGSQKAGAVMVRTNLRGIGDELVYVLPFSPPPPVTSDKTYYVNFNLAIMAAR